MTLPSYPTIGGMSKESDRIRNARGPNKRLGEKGPNTGGCLSLPFNAERKAAYCEELSATGLQTTAAKKLGVHRATVLRHLKEDLQFKQDAEDAMESFREGLQAEARRRAVDGTLKPMYFQGIRITEKDEDGKEVPAAVREYDTPLLILLLKRHCPEFKDKLVTENRNVNVDMGLADMEKMTPEQRAKLRELIDMEEPGEQDGEPE